MSMEPEDFAIRVGVKFNASVLAAGCRALACSIVEQHYGGGEDGAAVLEHCAALLDKIASGSGWDGIECSDAPSLDELRGKICGLREPMEKHGGVGALRSYYFRGGGTFRIWTCTACHEALATGPLSALPPGARL